MRPAYRHFFHRYFKAKGIEYSRRDKKHLRAFFIGQQTVISRIDLEAGQSKIVAMGIEVIYQFFYL